MLLQRHLEARTGRPIGDLVADLVLVPLGMRDSGIDHRRRLLTTAADHGRFLAHVLAIRDGRWEPLWRIDDELAWGAALADRRRAGLGSRLGPRDLPADPRVAVGPRRRRQPLRHRLPRHR